LKKIGVDALIVSDPGILTIIKKIWPQVEIHLSTQANCTNWQAAAFWHKQGVARIILGREVALDEIKEIKKKVPGLSLEYFVHGAMCMAYSGRCLLSRYFTGRSANLGDCAQPCRWEYSRQDFSGAETQEFHYRPAGQDEDIEIVGEQHGSYILNSKDLCLMKYLAELRDAGVDSFKIEGRAKSVYYQAVTVGAYRTAIDSLIAGKQSIAVKKTLQRLSKELETKLVHRGYTAGFLLGGKAGQNLESAHIACQWEFCGVVMPVSSLKLIKGVKKIDKDNQTAAQTAGKIFIKVHNQIRQGDKIEILTPQYDIIKIRIKRIFNENTGELAESAHGGQQTIISLKINRKIPEGSVIRRKLE
jgi:putative protease